MGSEVTRESNHHCHALNCTVNVPPRMHMCSRHWFMVPKAYRDILWAKYKPGQERRMDPSPAYLLAAARCVHAVATKEGQPHDEIVSEVGLYEAWADMLTGEPNDFMAIITGEAA